MEVADTLEIRFDKTVINGRSVMSRLMFAAVAKVIILPVVLATILGSPADGRP